MKVRFQKHSGVMKIQLLLSSAIFKLFHATASIWFGCQKSKSSLNKSFLKKMSGFHRDRKH